MTRVRGYLLTHWLQALIIADKTDVRRSRVKTRDNKDFDIHDRVNYAAVVSEVSVESRSKNSVETKVIKTGFNHRIQIFAQVTDYFEIFLAAHDNVPTCGGTFGSSNLNLMLMEQN